MKQKDDPLRRLGRLYPLRLQIRTLFSDMDVFRHINNGAISRFFEEGRADLNMRVFGANCLVSPSDGMALMFVHIATDYLQPVHYPGEVGVATAIRKIGNTSFETVQACFQDDVCVALAESVTVKTVDNRPTALTGGERLALEANMCRPEA